MVCKMKGPILISIKNILLKKKINRHQTLEFDNSPGSGVYLQVFRKYNLFPCRTVLS